MNMPKYIPFPAYPTDAPVDLSFVYADEKPAGKHGFLRVAGDNFAFEDGTPARFWGANFNSGACFPEHDYAKGVARRLAKYGCNIVRFHQLDSEWSTPNIFRFTKGRRLDNTMSLDAESLDRLDYLVCCLKQEGIYCYLDMMTYRQFKTGDGVAKADELYQQGAPYCLFDRRMIELQKKYAHDLWTHQNPYTGLMYKDDPVFVMTEIVAEVDLFLTFAQKLVHEPYVTEFRSLFRKWADTAGITADCETCDLNDNRNEALLAFKTKVTHDYYREMQDYLRGIGVKIPVAGTNFSWMYLACKAQQGTGDFKDSHLNLRQMDWSERVKKSSHFSLSGLREPGFYRNARMREFGKPFFGSEWDVTWPCEFRAESPILFAAVGALQNWSGFSIHTYAYSSRLDRMQILGKESSAGALGGVGYREGLFSTWNDPAKFGLFYHAALITRRGDVAPARNKITIRIGDLYNENKPALQTLCERSQVAVDFLGVVKDGVPDTEPIIPKAATEVRSDTGELYRNWDRKYGTIDTARTKCVYGFVGNIAPIALDGLTIDCKTDFAVIALSSLSDQPLAQADNILMTAVGRATNTDIKFDGDVLRDFGRPPILIEVIEAEISLRTDRTGLKVWAVNAEGFYVGRVPVTYADGILKFKVGETSLSMYYLIVED